MKLLMDIFNGKCVICSEETLVLSGKDKQRFVELLKEHYFDVNQIKNNKFLLQFKEKRTEKSICMSCAYIIDIYVSARNKFKESTRAEKKCSMCNKETNLTNGTNQLLNDANKLLKNANNNKKVSRLTKQICLECCFCIISWKKIENIITKYTLDSNALNGIKKRRHSAEDDADSESDSQEPSVKNIVPVRATRRTTRPIKNGKEVNNGAGNEKILKKNKNSLNISSPTSKKKAKFGKSDVDELEENLKHLFTVNSEISSKNVNLTNKIRKQIVSDDKMMIGIPYILLEAKKLKSENRIEQSDTDRTDLISRRNSSVISRTESENETPIVKNKRKKATKSQNDVSNSEVGQKKRLRSMRKTNTEDVILISDTEPEYAPVQKSTKSSVNNIPIRVSSRIKKGKSPLKNKSKLGKKAVKSKLNKCSECNKSFVKKYKLQLHELQHEASFKPVVVVGKESESNPETTDKTNSDNSDTEDNQHKDSVKKETDSNDNEKGNKDEEKDDSDEAQFDENLKEVVDATLSQLEKNIDEDSIESLKKENDKHKLTNEEVNDTNENDEPSENDDPLKLNDVSDDVIENDLNKNTNKKNDNENESDNEQKNETDDENEKLQSESVNEHPKSEALGTTDEINDDIEKTNEDAVDEISQQSEDKISDEKTEKINDDNLQNSSKEKGEVNEDENVIQTNGETNDSNFDNVESEERDKQIKENDCTNEENTAAVDDSGVVNVIDSDREDDELKVDETNNFKSVVIEDDASNSSNKDEEIEKTQTVGKENSESVVIENGSSDSCGSNEDSGKVTKENNLNTIEIEDESSKSSDGNIEKNKSIEKNIESSNKFDKNNSQNSDNDQVNNTPNSLITDSQIESADKGVSDEIQNTEHSDNIEKESDSEYESADIDSQSTDKTNNSVHDEDCEMEPLKISPESQRNPELTGNITPNKNSDKFEIVENLLHNLGA